MSTVICEDDEQEATDMVMRHAPKAWVAQIHAEPVGSVFPEFIQTDKHHKEVKLWILTMGVFHWLMLRRLRSPKQGMCLLTLPKTVILDVQKLHDFDIAFKWVSRSDNIHHEAFRILPAFDPMRDFAIWLEVVDGVNKRYWFSIIPFDEHKFIGSKGFEAFFMDLWKSDNTYLLRIIEKAVYKAAVLQQAPRACVICGSLHLIKECPRCGCLRYCSRKCKLSDKKHDKKCGFNYQRDFRKANGLVFKSSEEGLRLLAMYCL